jgi:hypothetical protein
MERLEFFIYCGLIVLKDELIGICTDFSSYGDSRNLADFLHERWMEEFTSYANK